jgi:MFS family permease
VSRTSARFRDRGDIQDHGGGSRRARLVAAFPLMANRPYRLLWVGQTVSSAGDALTLVAVVFAILRIGGTAADIGYVTAAATFTRVVFVLAGGVWADRLPRHLVMLTSDAVRAAVQSVLAILLLAGLAKVWELGLGAMIFGAAQAFFGPASTGLLAEIVPADQLQQGNALMSFAARTCAVGGPAAAGLLVAIFGPGLVFAVDAASFTASAASLALLRLPPRTMHVRNSFRADLTAGWHEMVIRPWYWLNLIAHAICNFAIPAYFVLGPVIATRMLGGASAWGAISASWAAGAVGGGVITLRIRPRRPLVAANLALALTALPLLALVRPMATWQIGIAAALSGGATIFINNVWEATMQQLIPDEILSRVDSYDLLISLVVMPVGYVVVGPLASHIGDTRVLVGAALILGATCGLTMLIPGIRAVRRTSEGMIADLPLRKATETVPVG